MNVEHDIFESFLNVSLREGIPEDRARKVAALAAMAAHIPRPEALDTLIEVATMAFQAFSAEADDGRG